MNKRTVLIGTTLAALVIAGVAYGGWSRSSGLTVQKMADLYQIDGIEKTWHKAASTKNINLMMSIWAPHASFTLGGKTTTGKPAIRKIFEKAGPFQPQNHWVSDTPAYKIRATVNGNKGTLYFECHYIDVASQKVVAVLGADQDIRKIHGKWLITNLTVATPTLSP
ncbi:MAG TPA: nuclear transport factor 2 family protein [Gaiellaceae bacterium]